MVVLRRRVFVCVCFFAASFSFSGLSQVGWLLPMKRRTNLARDVVDTFVTHAGLVHDVTDTDLLDAK